MRHERLEVYQRAVKLNHDVRKRLLRSQLDLATKGQITRAFLSITANIAEGTERHTGPDCRKFYNYAKASAAECCAHLDVIRPERHVETTVDASWRSELLAISRILGALIHKARLPQDRR